MTPAYIAPEQEKRSYRFSILRMILISVMLFLLVAGSLYLYHTAFREYGKYLVEEEKKTSAWMIEQLSFMLPFIAVAVFQYAVYHKHDRRDGILQRERAYEILILAGLTYLVLLPLLWVYSDRQLILSLMAGVKVEINEGKEYESLMMQLAHWFIRFTIPLMLLFVYHMAKAKSEIAENLEKAESEAKEKAASEAKEQAAAQAAETAESTEETAPELRENAAATETTDP